MVVKIQRQESVWERGSVNGAGPLAQFGCPDLSCNASSEPLSLIGGFTAGVRRDILKFEGSRNLICKDKQYSKSKSINTHYHVCIPTSHQQ